MVNDDDVRRPKEIEGVGRTTRRTRLDSNPVSTIV